MWDVFMDQMEPLGAKIPWMLASGNHEMDWPSGADRYSAAGGIDSGTYSTFQSCEMQQINWQYFTWPG